MKRVCLLFVLLLTVGIQAIAQTTHNVTGKVLDEKGAGYAGAAISVKGTQMGTISDANGDFSFDVPDGSNTLIIQAEGYDTRAVKDEGEGVIVRLMPESRQLEGAQVTPLDVRKNKRNLGYTATTVGSEDLMQGNGSSAISDLQGKVAGANISSSTDAPGGSTSILLRGPKSFLQSNNAIIVVDGVITSNYDRTQSSLGVASKSFSQLSQVDFGNSANDLNPEEIESITILQGPAATVLYGQAGANGALMITTKHGRHSDNGKKTKLDITYKATYSQSDVLKSPEVQHMFGQGDIYNGVTDNLTTNKSWGYQFDGLLRGWGQVIGKKQLVKSYVDQPDNIKSFFNHGKNLNNFVSLSGGSEHSTYFVSLDALTSNGAVPNTFYDRYSIRFNGSTQLSNRFYSTVNVNYLNTYSRSETGGNGAGSVLNALYNQPRDIPVWELKDYRNSFYSMQYYDTSGVSRYGQYSSTTKNPYWVSNYYDNRDRSDRVLGDARIGYKNGDFNVYDRVGGDVSADRAFYKSPQLSSQAVDPSYVGGFNLAGGYTQYNYNTLRFSNDLIASFTHQLSNNFGMNAFVGHNVTIEHQETLAGIIDPATNGLVTPNNYNLNNSLGPVVAYNYLMNRRTFGVFGDVSFNFQKELFLEMMARNDWSSALITGQNSYFYPGANAGWVFTERLNGTGFKENVMNYGKVRIGAGGSGNGNPAYSNNASGFIPSTINSTNGTINTPFNGIPAYEIKNAMGDQNLKPERTHEVEVGTDLSFLKDRLSLSFTYYSSYTNDVIALEAIAPSTGFSYNFVNIGNITNKGEELAMRGTPISTKYGLKWDLFGTLSHNVNEVVSLSGNNPNNNTNVILGGFNGMSIVAAVGHPYGTYLANDIQYWQSPKDGSWHPVVDPKTGLPLSTPNPVYKGSYLPKLQASWGTDLTYKGLKLHALFVTKQGGQFFSENKMLMDMNGTSQESTVNNRERYVFTNSVYQVRNTNTYLANTTRYLPYDYYTTTEQKLLAQGLLDASYIKLKELSFSYRIPRKYYDRTPFGTLEAGVFGNNLIIWTPKSNHYDDPEASSVGALGNGQGLNYTANPSLRSYGGFIKVTF